MNHRSHNSKEHVERVDGIWTEHSKQYEQPNKQSTQSVALAPSVYASRTWQHSLRWYILFIFYAMILVAINAVGDTVSYLYDEEEGEGNTLEATSLDFNVVIVANNVVEATLGPGDIRRIILALVPEEGSAPIEYQVSSEFIAGNQTFCDALHLTATGTPFVYDGPILDLTSATTTSLENWLFDLTYTGDGSGVSAGDICEVDLVYEGWQEGDEGNGFTDDERIHLIITADEDNDIETASLLLQMGDLGGTEENDDDDTSEEESTTSSTSTTTADTAGPASESETAPVADSLGENEDSESESAATITSPESDEDSNDE